MTANTKSPLWQITFYDIYTQSFRSFRFIPFRSVFLSRCVYFLLTDMCVPVPVPVPVRVYVLCCAVLLTWNTYTHTLTHLWTRCMCLYAQECLRFVWFSRLLSHSCCCLERWFGVSRVFTCRFIRTVTLSSSSTAAAAVAVLSLVRFRATIATQSFLFLSMFYVQSTAFVFDKVFLTNTCAQRERHSCIQCISCLCEASTALSTCAR